MLDLISCIMFVELRDFERKRQFLLLFAFQVKLAGLNFLCTA